MTRYCGDLSASWREGNLFVDNADPFVMISNELWQQILDGECAVGVLGGEGILVIHASNGVFRYDLTGERNASGSWAMRRVSDS